MRVSDSPSDKYLDQTSLQYLVEKIKEEIKKNGGSSGENVDLSDYYTKSQIDDIVKQLPSGSTGVGISGVSINGAGHLIVSLTDGTSADVGNVVGKNGTNGVDGQDGADGFSPTIVENAENTDTQYKLDITTAAGTFTTPNLKGKDGQDGKDGTGGSGGGASSEEYSTDEIEVGTWIDGKPIYQKVVPVTLSSNAKGGSVASDVTKIGSTVSALVDMRAVRTQSQFMVMSTTHIMNTSISYITSFSDFKDAIFSMSLAKDGTLFINHGYKYNGWKLNIILKYVK
ncbi:hypothetical protein [Anaerostipes sp. MSJ-23]|jgi:hypothetical protein|uniref:hypothetical protein n=1 Tax=Anaerostipes sp. MSJ-23 TaxID=2841520 RepID=UPI001C11A93E|nr:hypothetical protein [Anaerostipes sp. MSJ-23]MBU5458903.1 hypothetical protein [Anaerostipes sp. MSJ-23]